MSEEFKPVILAGRTFRVRKPSQGQFEALVRIYKTLQRGTDDDRTEFWINQVNRLGILMDSLIAEGDLEAVDELVLTGKTDSSTLLRAILEAHGDDSEKAKPTKANGARVKRT